MAAQLWSAMDRAGGLTARRQESRQVVGRRGSGRSGTESLWWRAEAMGGGGMQWKEKQWQAKCRVSFNSRSIT